MPNLGQNRRFFVPCDLEIRWMTLKNNRVPLLCHIKLYAAFHHHMYIQTGVTVRKLLSWVLTWSCDLDLWPLTLTFVWTSLLSLVITPENFMMIQWQEHFEKGVTVGRLQWNWQHHRKWSQLRRNPASDSSWCLLLVVVEIVVILLD